MKLPVLTDMEIQKAFASPVQDFATHALPRQRLAAAVKVLMARIISGGLLALLNVQTNGCKTK